MQEGREGALEERREESRMYGEEEVRKRERREGLVHYLELNK